MVNTATIQIRDKGIITLPVELRRRYHLGTGDVYTLADLGQGTFLLTPGTSKVAARGDQIAHLMAEHSVTLDEILETLDQEREAYYREHYVQA
jgi:bifunctional DNA-binding transcriptional regulator/antitoxin component of YhaV-PrlF toxin-antitoxin module